MINADLHCHSTVSDGTLTPEELAARAAANGVQMWSLTDHDEVGGLARAAKAAAEHGLIFVPGVEISVTWSAVTLHIVGLNVSYIDSPLEKGLASVRNGRTERAMEMSRQLVANTTDVGDRFADEARKIHYGDAPERAIRGQASPEQRRALLEEGIEIMSLPIPAALKGPVQ